MELKALIFPYELSGFGKTYSIPLIKYCLFTLEDSVNPNNLNYFSSLNLIRLINSFETGIIF